MAGDGDGVTHANISELCATSRGLVDDMHLTIQTAHTLRRRAADLRRQAREARAGSICGPEFHPALGPARANQVEDDPASQPALGRDPAQGIARPLPTLQALPRKGSQVAPRPGTRSGSRGSGRPDCVFGSGAGIPTGGYRSLDPDLDQVSRRNGDRPGLIIALPVTWQKRPRVSCSAILGARRDSWTSAARGADNSGQGGPHVRPGGTRGGQWGAPPGT
jgi:hypothetical protein